ncbi:hypothetical protein [Collimonas sp.]|jgi:hypothetical protein|uniref:hypothetical protein n=1 Tax=Collimonas sp. TaxID=1963772 RepID=UPI002BCBAB56|nr:hypothetical protein [Collimonas sp.]HWW05972.1 hypothetical protein [Collimonas sp.]
MNRHETETGNGRRRARREVVEVPERKIEDKRLDQLLNVRKQRLSRLERERNAARAAWRAERQALHDIKQRWREASHQAKEQWRQARAAFLAMSTTSGQFRKAKSMYERMKQDAAQLYMGCQEKLQRCRQAGKVFFEARQCVLEANRQQEKLSILRDEMRLLASTDEM